MQAASHNSNVQKDSSKEFTKADELESVPIGIRGINSQQPVPMFQVEQMLLEADTIQTVSADPVLVHDSPNLSSSNSELQLSAFNIATPKQFIMASILKKLLL